MYDFAPIEYIRQDVANSLLSGKKLDEPIRHMAYFLITGQYPPLSQKSRTMRGAPKGSRTKDRNIKLFLDRITTGNNDYHMSDSAYNTAFRNGKLAYLEKLENQKGQYLLRKFIVGQESVHGDIDNCIKNIDAIIEELTAQGHVQKKRGWHSHRRK